MAVLSLKIQTREGFQQRFDRHLNDLPMKFLHTLHMDYKSCNVSLCHCHRTGLCKHHLAESRRHPWCRAPKRHDGRNVLLRIGTLMLTVHV